jgi:hypothetical protein
MSGNAEPKDFAEFAAKLEGNSNVGAGATSKIILLGAKCPVCGGEVVRVIRRIRKPVCDPEGGLVWFYDDKEGPIHCSRCKVVFSDIPPVSIR